MPPAPSPGEPGKGRRRALPPRAAPSSGRARRAELKGEAPAVTGTERAGKCRGAGASARLRLREEQERQAKPSPAQACGLRAESAAWACLRRRVGAAASVTPRCRFFSRPLSHDTTHTHSSRFIITLDPHPVYFGFTVTRPLPPEHGYAVLILKQYW